MLSRRPRPLIGAVFIVLLVPVGCARRTGDDRSRIDPAASFAAVLTARDACDAARARLASSPDPASQRVARLEFEGDFRRYQRELARFLTTALNDFPAAPETRQGLDLYARAAIEIADQTVAHDGDREAALRGLDDARRYFGSVGLPPPPELLACLARVRHGLRAPERPSAPPPSPP